MSFKFLIALPFFLSGVYHILTIVFPGFGEPSTLNRHLIFIAINFFMSALAISAKKMFLFCLGILIIQQLYSHGSSFYIKWFYENRVDYYSILVCFGLPLYLVILIKSNIVK